MDDGCSAAREQAATRRGRRALLARGGILSVRLRRVGAEMR